METIQIRLSKFDNQARQYKHFRMIYVGEAKLTAMIPNLRPIVKEFYLYEWNYEGIPIQHYSLNPDVFESIEVPQIHMT
jgi:hypothetical protein